MNLSKNIYTAFKQYTEMGLDPLPIPYTDGHPTKKPEYLGWTTKAANHEFSNSDLEDPCNIGILLGGNKNLTDIDCDSPEAVRIGAEVLDGLMEKTGKTLVFGRQSKPRSHFIWYADKSMPTEKIVDPTDDVCIIEYRCVKEDGNRGKQTVFPPSLNCDPKTGLTEEVRFENDSATEPVFVETKKLQSRFRLIAATALLAKHFPVEGQRHNTILALAGVFARNEMPVEKAAMVVKLAYRNSEGYNGDEKKAEDDVKSVYKTFANDSTTHLFGYPTLTEIMPKAVVDRVLELLGIDRPQTTYNLTDAGNGQRLVDKHHDEIRYCVDEGCWYIWDGVRWRKDLVRRIRELAKGIAADIRSEADAMKMPTTTGDEDQDKVALAQFEARKRELLKWANRSENADGVSKTIISAESDARITCFHADFDRDANLLNCPNFVVNLYTGDTMPHDRKLMLSNLCPVEYDPKANHPAWEESLDAFTRKHSDLKPFLKRVAGYSIQGDKSEERIMILFGPGNAGKGTFMDWITNTLGPDYACAMDANSVLRQKRDSAAASGDIARLEGKRIVVVSEIEKGSRLQESFMKGASGNDALVARALYKSEREFRPTHQFWFQTNYRPGFDSTDSGNKRRYIEIPFDNDLKVDPAVKFDPMLKNRMRQDAGFLRAVLAWAVEGCVEWRQHGLEIPESVKTATAELFAHNDFLSDFLKDMCVVNPGEKVPVIALSDAYKRWCEGQGEEPAQGRTFNHMMEERGFERRQARINGVSGKAWVGIRLKEHEELMVSVGEAEALDDVNGSTISIRRRQIRQADATVFNRRGKAG
ncbi:MAG: bifunctional DNA primase/polymerase [Acidobacteria bacterium]|nr:bifunctional DNA primase/polymerase [Acidobacteriota bacterium]